MPPLCISYEFLWRVIDTQVNLLEREIMLNHINVGTVANHSQTALGLPRKCNNICQYFERPWRLVNYLLPLNIIQNFQVGWINEAIHSSSAWHVVCHCCSTWAHHWPCTKTITQIQPPTLHTWPQIYLWLTVLICPLSFIYHNGMSYIKDKIVDILLEEHM